MSDTTEELGRVAGVTAEELERFSEALAELCFGVQMSRRAIDIILRKLARRPWTIRQYRKRGKGRHK